ncbi:protein of unknown function [Pseudomonas sp. JV551A1]|uniref:Uncharacterized protein n=1 Tax=Pseudomonas inefficax TaxID=2078786 RepID=A0AAQ1P8W5_9PSED|nr:hypothetical protein [Pseudomonas]SPO53700.1 protein of unknown function [Pseudomonas sp. JV551A1]SPO59779.1 protein of unknown function [Pseudomonas inefficax]
MSDTLEIRGTLFAPFVPAVAEPPTRLCIIVTGLLEGEEQMLATCSSQATGAPLPFRLHLDRNSLGDIAELTLEARCTAGIGEDAVLARTTQKVLITDVLQGIALELNLVAMDSAPVDPEKHPLPPTVIELTGLVSIPPELCQEVAYLDATLLVVQEDGHSTRYSSNLAEHSLYLKGESAPFSLFIDVATLPKDRPTKLHLGLYNLERNTIYAGNVLKNLDFSNPPDLSMIALRKPRR